jgi:ATP-binding cassette, subfamily B, bacterial
MARALVFSLKPLTEMGREAARFTAVLRRFRGYLRAQRRTLILAVAASIGYTLATLLEPWTMQVIFDGVILQQPVVIFGLDLGALVSGDRMKLLTIGAGAVLLLAAVRGQLYYNQRVLTATSGIDVVMAIRRQLFEHLQALSLDFHHGSRTGDLMMRMTGDIVMLREMVVAALVTLFTQGLVLISILAIMLHMNVRLTLIALAVCPLLFLILSLFRLRLVAAAQKQRKREGRLASSAHEALESVQLVQAYTAERYEAARFKQLNQRSMRSGVRVTRVEAQLNRAVQVALAVGLCLFLWLGTQDVIAGRLSPGQLLVFVAYLRGLYRPLRDISKLTQRMAKASACGDRVIEILDTVPTIQEPAHPTILKRVRGEIELRNVTLRYRQGVAALREVTLCVGRRELVALVGPTGAGKTSVLSLIPRFYDPQAGQVLIDGRDVREIRIRSLRRQISLLPQQAVVTGVTVGENIAYGALGSKRGAGPEQIRQAAQAAHAHDFIAALPKGYDTVVGERGATLSGGQRQRIAIARAFLRQAPILLLDEPTTGLDPISGQAVIEALKTLTRKRTTLVVAHQLSTILQAHRIVFLEDGCVREQGTHADLIRAGGGYAAFFETEWGEMASCLSTSRGGGTPEQHVIRRR